MTAMCELHDILRTSDTDDGLRTPKPFEHIAIFPGPVCGSTRSETGAVQQSTSSLLVVIGNGGMIKGAERVEGRQLLVLPDPLQLLYLVRALLSQAACIC